MSKQKSITSFFKVKPSEKRKSDIHDEQKPKKVARIDDRNEDIEEKEISKSENNSNFGMNEKYTEMFKGLEIMDKSWFNALQPEMDKEYFKKLSKFVSDKRNIETVYPTVENVFRWTVKSLNKIKVVILGQDPYHGPNQAHGLSFSVLRPTRPPPSLKNMFKELIQDENVPLFTREPDHGDLSTWAQQGVLMLNAVLTVTKAKANSHKGQGWEKFTDSAIKAVSNNCNSVVFLLWGGPAGKKASLIDKKKHLILQAPHPSPLSAHRGYLGCQHFSKANDYLKKANRGTIQWESLYDDTA